MKNNRVKVTQEVTKTSLQVLDGILLILLIISLALAKGMALLSLVLLTAALIWYAVGIRKMDDVQRAATKRWMSVAIYLCVMLISITPYCALSRLIMVSKAALLMVGITGLVVGGVAVFMFQESKWGQVFWEFLDTGKSGGKKGVASPGDLIICDDAELVGKKVKNSKIILPCKDRFLHMLIIGPTGTGKTSQVILPMVNQDIHNFDAGVTVIEPKGDLARQVAMMAKECGRDYLYFDPSVSNCPFFNPLIGDETDVIENTVTTFLMLNPDSPQYFKDLSEELVRNSLKVLKRLDKSEGCDGKYSTFIWMSRLLQNNAGQGRELVQKFSRICSETPDEAKENADIAAWFLNEYFMERSKIYENSSGIRAQVSKVIANQHLRRILNPDIEKGEQNQIDFDKHLENGGVICISTAQSTMRDLGKFLGYFLILQLQSAVFRRPGNEDTRRAHFLYIDEFQTYTTPGFSEMLTQGRSYRVASHLATQARAEIAMGGGKDGKNFVCTVDANARNVILFPGCSAEDAKYYSEKFGTKVEVQEVRSETHKTFNLITGGLDRLGHPSESIRYDEKIVPRFYPSDLMYRPFGEIVVSIVERNTLQLPRVGKVNYIDADYDRKLKQMVENEIVVYEVRNQGKEDSADLPPLDEFTFERDLSSESEGVPASNPTSSFVMAGETLYVPEQEAGEEEMVGKASPVEVPVCSDDDDAWRHEDPRETVNAVDQQAAQAAQDGLDGLDDEMDADNLL